MDPIIVPAVPKSAFNENRPLSDLIRKQVEHFRHVEEKLPADLRASLPDRNPKTEGDAALYIAAMTRLLRSQAAPAARPALIVMPSRGEPESEAESGLALAAAAETESAGAMKETTPDAKKTRSRGKKKREAKA